MVKRKIPARKHHGVRDPLKQLADQFEKIKNKINNPPAKNDQEKIPYSLTQLIKAKNEAKSGKFKKKRCIGVEDKPKNTRNKIKPVRRLPNEEDEDYLKRVNRATTESLKEAEYEMKYGVQVLRNSKTGEITVKKKPKDEISELIENRRRNKGKKGKAEIQNKIDPKLKREVIKQVLSEEKTEKKEIKEFKKDYIQFGEIVHAPPTFSVIPKKAKKSETTPRPGKKDLLLKAVIEDNTPKNKISKTKSNANYKGKRKDLTIGARSMIEAERAKVVEIYRNLKKNMI